MTDSESTAAADATPPFVTVVKGNPTPAQVAALTAIIAARSAAADGPRTTIRNEWGRPVDLLRPNWATATSFYTQLW